MGLSGMVLAWVVTVVVVVEIVVVTGVVSACRPRWIQQRLVRSLPLLPAWCPDEILLGYCSGCYSA